MECDAIQNEEMRRICSSFDPVGVACLSITEDPVMQLASIQKIDFTTTSLLGRDFRFEELNCTAFSYFEFPKNHHDS